MVEKLIIYIVVGIIYILVSSLLRSKKVESTVKILRKITTNVVEHVEQVAKIQDLHGDQKKEYAKTLIKQITKELGLNVKDGIIETLIESSVMYMNMLNNK